MVLIYIDHSEKEIKKSSHEAISYGAAIAQQLGCSAEALILGNVNEDLSGLGKLGASKVHQLNHDSLNNFDAKVHASLVASIAKKINAQVIVFAHNINGKAIAPAVAVKLDAGIVTGACSLPNLQNGFEVTKTVFSGKAFASIKIETPIKVIAINQNCFGIQNHELTATIHPIDITIPTLSLIHI